MQTILVANRKGGCGKTMTAITLGAGALAAEGTVALADADRAEVGAALAPPAPGHGSPDLRLDWTKSAASATCRAACDWLVIDAPGALKGGRAEALIAEADGDHSRPPSYFDADSTRRFLKDVEEIKRVRKGKVGLHLVANRVRPQQRATERLRGFLAELGHEPVAWISERAAYADLAEQGLAIFDARTRAATKRPLARVGAPVLWAVPARPAPEPH